MSCEVVRLGACAPPPRVQVLVNPLRSLHFTLVGFALAVWATTSYRLHTVDENDVLFAELLRD